ncbi:MAG: hypothetical protein GX430_06665 [Treponema sp.]|nr:hypothetical protein [Treponema sp.]
MKAKTSITLSQELLEELRGWTSEGNRSDFIERALWRYLELLRREARDRDELGRIDGASERLNREALDVLSYQVPV